MHKIGKTSTAESSTVSSVSLLSSLHFNTPTNIEAASSLNNTVFPLVRKAESALALCCYILIRAISTWRRVSTKFEDNSPPAALISRRQCNNDLYYTIRRVRSKNYHRCRADGDIWIWTNVLKSMRTLSIRQQAKTIYRMAETEHVITHVTRMSERNHLPYQQNQLNLSGISCLCIDDATFSFIRSTL